jgi:hypothetical protein
MIRGWINSWKLSFHVFQSSSITTRNVATIYNANLTLTIHTDHFTLVIHRFTYWEYFLSTIILCVYIPHCHHNSYFVITITVLSSVILVVDKAVWMVSIAEISLLIGNLGRNYIWYIIDIFPDRSLPAKSNSNNSSVSSGRTDIWADSSELPNHLRDQMGPQLVCPLF